MKVVKQERLLLKSNNKTPKLGTFIVLVCLHFMFSLSRMTLTLELTCQRRVGSRESNLTEHLILKQKI